MERTDLTAEEFLWSAREAKAEVRRRHLRVQELEARCSSITAKMSGMPGGGGDRHSLEQVYILLSEERTRELDAIREEQAKYHEVEDLINSLPEQQHRVVLRLRYLRGLKWNRVQREMERENWYFCDRQLYRINDDALVAVERALREGVTRRALYTEAASEFLHRAPDQA